MEKHEDVTPSQASPAAHSAPPLAGAQQDEPESAPQQMPWSHFRWSAQLPWVPSPVQGVPSPVMATQDSPAQAWPLRQSLSRAQTAEQTATGCSAADVQSTGSKVPQSRASPAQALPSGTVTETQVASWQVASRREPWQSVVGP